MSPIDEASFLQWLLHGVPSRAALPDAAAWPQRHPILVLALVAYAVWYRRTWRATTLARAWGPRWLALLVARFNVILMRICSANLKTLRPPDSGVDASKRHLVVWHPHGAYTTMALMHCGLHTVASTPLTWFPAVAPVLFALPIFREVLLLLNARSVEPRVLEKLARAGCTIGIQPGGIPEQIRSDSTREIAVFPPRLGFIRLAMRHGLDLLPVYIFGENQAYDTCGPRGRAFSAWAYRMCHVPIVPIMGRYGVPWLVPKSVDIHVVWGEPVSVGPPNDAPTDAEVEEVYERYVAELRRLFDAHKDACLPPEVAALGLTITRRTSSAAPLPTTDGGKAAAPPGSSKL